MKSILLFCAFLSLFLVACGDPTPPDAPVNVNTTNVTAANYVSYGNGIYYFANADSLKAKIQRFLDTTYFCGVSMAPFDTKGYGATTGYWVVLYTEEVSTDVTKLIYIAENFGFGRELSKYVDSTHVVVISIGTDNCTPAGATNGYYVLTVPMQK